MEHLIVGQNDILTIYQLLEHLIYWFYYVKLNTNQQKRLILNQNHYQTIAVFDNYKNKININGDKLLYRTTNQPDRIFMMIIIIIIWTMALPPSRSVQSTTTTADQRKEDFTKFSDLSVPTPLVSGQFIYEARVLLRFFGHSLDLVFCTGE